MTTPISKKPFKKRSLLIPSEYIPHVVRFCSSLKASEDSFLLADQIRAHLDEFFESTTDIDDRAKNAIQRLFRGCQEIIIDGDSTYALLRPRFGDKVIMHIHPALDHLEQISRGEYLAIKDAYLQSPEEAAKKGLVLDFAPFFSNFPRVNEPSEMGEGISFLNRHLSSQMYQNPTVFRRALLGFLQDCHIDNINLLVNEYLSTPEILLEQLDEVRTLLIDKADDVPAEELIHELRVHGFEPGWGRNAKTIREGLTLLARLIESADPSRFEEFLERLPLVRTALMVSPHGWFAQEGVLGRPDTGGQVTYVLDQARALERQMAQAFYDCGIDVAPRVVVLTRLIPEADGTTCNAPREKILGTEDSWIVRVPFHDSEGEVIPHWISRFQIWPYLEQFAEDSTHVVVSELMGKPDLILGHYSDGNLVAHRLAENLDVTHCAVVHALEKTKYLLSDMHWAAMEHDYRFSMHFTADLIAYNSADFIISSSYREIGGTPDEMGMFESYEFFSMPGLYRVQSGMDPRLARHNIVPPGASEEYFFPNSESQLRVEAVTNRLNEWFFSAEPPADSVGHLNNPNLPPIFAMARMDKIKNLPGLVEIFGKSQSLRKHSNLFLISSITNAELSSDQEEIEEINRTYELIEQYNLDGHVRWCAARLDKVETGEIYRIVADRGGVFAQPAFMETFGLTVIEAMACGLPVVVTCFGGPSEIVLHEECGEIVNPNDHQAYADSLEKVLTDLEVWELYAKKGITRVHDAYNWATHAKRVLRLANVYSYWNYIDVMNRPALDRYIHTLYHTVYRPRTEAMLEE